MKLFVGRVISVCVLAVVLMYAQPLSAQVAAVRGLAFGLVVRGVPKTIAVNSTTSAHWTYSPVISILSNVTYTLPTQLTRVGGGATLPISFCTTCARYRVGNNNVDGATTFNPNAKQLMIGLSLFTTTYFWLGGTVSPSASQMPGDYTGSIVITLTLF